MTRLTRRQVMAGLGALAIGGCRGRSSDRADASADESPAAPDPGDGARTTAQLDAGRPDAGRPDAGQPDAAAYAGPPYTVELEPMGAVTFARPPRRFACFHCAEADMAVALGVADGLVAMVHPDQMVDNTRLFYRQIPGLDVDFSGVGNLVGLLGADVERFLSLDVDVVLMDPNVPVHYFRFKPSDVERIERRVAPFFGHFVRFARGAAWPAQYPQRSLYTVFEKTADVFRRRARCDAIRAIHDGMMASIHERLPPQAVRPRVLSMSGASDPARGKFHVLTLDGTAPPHGGNQVKHFHDLGVRDAAKGVATGEWGQVDAEGIAALAPDAIVVAWTWDKPADAFTERFVEPMRSHALLSTLPAVRAGRVFSGGSLEQGPLINLFHTELLATQLYPEVFGPPPTRGEAPQKPLFDRARLGDAIAGRAR